LDVGVYDDSLGRVEGVSEHDVRCLASYARQLGEFPERARYFATVALH
jgi:hypothetical protein